MAHSLMVCTVDVHQLAAIVRNRIDNALILDSRSFLEYNASHVVNAVNVGCAKLMKRRLQQEKLCIEDFLAQNCHWDVDRSIDIIVYDQNTQNPKYLPPESFMAVFLQKLLPVYNSVNVLQGGFLEFQAAYPELCEDERTKYAPLTSLSQPCLPVTNHGPTRILPFVYLGSQHDAINRDVLKHYNITYQLNVSTSCPKPDFIQDSHFMRIPVIDNYSEKLLPHFSKAFQFLDKVKESGGCVLIHCLAGISRSATIAIAFVMKTLKMTSDEAYRFVKAKRPTISPNFNFLGQLLEYEKQLQRESVLVQTSESSTAPMFSSSSPAFDKRRTFGDAAPETAPLVAQNFFLESYTVRYSDISEIKTSRKMHSSYTTSANQNLSDKLSSFTCIPAKQPAAVSIKCLPVSSLKELNFTSCHTSSFKLSERGEHATKSTNKAVTSPTRSCGSFTLQLKRTEKKQDGVLSDVQLSDCKLDVARSATYNDFSSPSDLKSFEFDSKGYNRSDSVSTSGLGSEGSDYADSWNDFMSSCERETDILMDDDYPSVPCGEEEQHKLLDFDDGVSLYTKYDAHYDRSHGEYYSQAVPSQQRAKKSVMKYEKPLKFSNSIQPDAQHVGNSEDFRKAHLLYRAQSCPGIIGSDSEVVSTPDAGSTSPSGVKLRKMKSSNSTKDKFRNRYSCSNIDYANYSQNGGFSRESCPESLHLSSGSKGSKLSSHCNYRHSMIEVS